MWYITPTRLSVFLKTTVYSICWNSVILILTVNVVGLYHVCTTASTQPIEVIKY